MTKLSFVGKLHTGIQKQRGAALLIMLVILVVGATGMMVSSLNGATMLSERSNITSQALAQAKAALIGRAVADNHPGSLPCPDSSNTGTADALSGVDCPSYLGRLPWKTLGLPDLRDESGERLWYALSPNYRDYTNKINSNTPGILQVYDNTGTTLLTPAGSEAAAIVFSPGAAVGTQQRGSPTTDQLLATNYLETGPNSVNNSVSGGPFVSANKSATFNDKLTIINTRDIISIVEKRVTKDLSTAFASYLIAIGNYPHPANFSCTTSSTCTSDTSVCTGKIPAATLSPYIPNTWIASNQWVDAIYYTAGTNYMGGGMGGMGCTTTLNISGANTKALFILPGVPLNGQSRGSTSLSASNIANYIEDSENKNLDATYITPSTNSNDTLQILP